MAVIIESLSKLQEHFCNKYLLVLLLPESIMETCSVVLTFDSVDEILWCYHLNETSSTVLLQGTIRFTLFYK